MGERSAIEWTDASWNPIRRCSRVSEGCRNCYAERQAIRIGSGRTEVLSDASKVRGDFDNGSRRLGRRLSGGALSVAGARASS